MWLQGTVFIQFQGNDILNKMRPFCIISADTFWKIHPESGYEKLIFKRFCLLWACFDSSDCEIPSKWSLLSNFVTTLCRVVVVTFIL